MKRRYSDTDRRNALMHARAEMQRRIAGALLHTGAYCLPPVDVPRETVATMCARVGLRFHDGRIG